MLAEIATGLKIDPVWLDEIINTAAIKEQLKTNTQELIERGGFGSPTLFVNGTDMYFGNDRLPLVREALRSA